MFSEDIKYPESGFKRSFGSWIRSGVHFQNIRRLLIISSCKVLPMTGSHHGKLTSTQFHSI